MVTRYFVSRCVLLFVCMLVVLSLGCATTGSIRDLEKKLDHKITQETNALSEKLTRSEEKQAKQLDVLHIAIRELSVSQKTLQDKLYHLGGVSRQEGLAKDEGIIELQERVANLERQKRTIPKSPPISPIILKPGKPIRALPSIKKKEGELIPEEVRLLNSIEDPVVLLYLDTIKALINKQYAKARKLADDLLSQYKDSEVADDAQFIKAEAFFKESLYANALYEYDKVAVNYPKENNAPRALLKEAICYKKLGSQNDARNVLVRLVREYPDSEASVHAKERLAQNTAD